MPQCWEDLSCLPEWPFVPASLSPMSIPAADTRWVLAAISVVAAAGNRHEPGFPRRAMSEDRASDSVRLWKPLHGPGCWTSEAGMVAAHPLGPGGEARTWYRALG